MQENDRLQISFGSQFVVAEAYFFLSCGCGYVPPFVGTHLSSREIADSTRCNKFTISGAGLLVT